jgi:uncharacterized membrane protein
LLLRKGSLQKPKFGASATLDTIIAIITTIIRGVLKKIRKRNHVTFRINQEIPSVKLIVFLASMVWRTETNKKIETKNSINTEEIKK